MDPSTSAGVVLVFEGASTGVVLNHRPPIPERFAEIRLESGGFQDFVQLTDEALEQALGESDNVALIGLKPAHAPRTAATSVVIDGPLEVDTAGVYEWTAEPDGGLGSYTYEWYWQVDFQTPTCNYQTAWTLVEDEEDFYAMAVSELDYDFRLRVDIETHGETASGGIKVYVGDGSQVCPT